MTKIIVYVTALVVCGISCFFIHIFEKSTLANVSNILYIKREDIAPALQLSPVKQFTAINNAWHFSDSEIIQTYHVQTYMQHW